MAKRPSQGKNEYRRVARRRAGGDNVRTSGGSVRRVNNARPRRLGNSLSR